MDTAVDEDATLMLAYAQGDLAAFEALYARHRGTLYRFLLRACRQPAVADELFQETWSRVIAARERYQPQAKFTTWLLQIAHNLLVDSYRRKRPTLDGEAGELCFRGPSSLRDYFRAPEATAQTLTPDGFVRTGDMVTQRLIDGVRCFAFEGRLRDNINRGGEKIGCEEVEAYVSHNPAVADAKLVAMPDALYGEKACVYLILRTGHAAPTVRQLADFLVTQGLAKFKCPERIEIVEEFPVTRVGKVDKAALRRDVAARISAEHALEQYQARCAEHPDSGETE